MPGGLEGDDATALDRFAGELDRRLQMLGADGGVAGFDALIGLAGFEEFEDRRDHDARVLEGRLAMADTGIYTDVVAPIDGSAHLIYSIPPQPAAVNVEAGAVRSY